jgi:predicted nucleic acid-binding protein
MRVLLDTGIFINVLNNELGAEFSEKFLQKIQNKEIDGLISTITVAEIFSIYHRMDEKDTIRAKVYVESIIKKDKIIPVFKPIAELGGKIKSKYRLSLGDAIIIATAMLTNCECLVSLDKEMKKVDLIEIKEPKDLL